MLLPANRTVVIGSGSRLVEDFDIISLAGDQRKPGRFLFGLSIPLMNGCAVRTDGGTQNLILRFAIVGNPEFGGITGGDPESVIRGNRYGQVTANTLAVIVAIIGQPLEIAQKVGYCRRCIDGNIGDVHTGNPVPNLPSY